MEPIPEARVLTLAGLLQAVQYVLMAVPANLELGTVKTLSPRDPARLVKPLMEQVSPVTGRLHRALTNHFEGLALFTLAVVALALTGKASGFTLACAWTYLAARVLYVPAYALGLVPWRSVVWFAGWLATLAMMLAAVL
jgi:uncharacterized MAPEG superfamily protein